MPDLAEVELAARHPDATALNAVWDRIVKCAQAGALGSETKFEFEQGSNHPNFLPNDILAEVLSRAMQKAGGYSYSPEEREFAATLQRSIGSAPQGPGPESVRTDKSEGPFPASGDPSDVIWVAPTGQLMAATYVPGVTSHTWQATAFAGSTIGRKGMLVEARTLALAGVELFENPAIVQAARTAFDKRLKGRTWTTRIGRDEKPPIN